ncbi:MAG: PfkB family carbohydrate kinase, partial [Candidatus Altiarchaeota archaeon]|nr:PfkB family carbohydrate kinase [Candidatus Altiarchaeota archaeon]
MKLDSILDRFRGKRILVLGDLMLDKFIWGDVSRISPEAPVPIVHVTSQSIKLGGAANAANNLKTLGAEVFIAGVVSEDTIGGELLEELKIKGINTEGVVVDRKRPTTLKTRVISLNQQVIRLDKESREEISDPISDKILGYVEDISSKVDGVIISDYGKGVITYEILKSISERAKINEVPVVVDPDLRNF